jgi:hypothetical protein
MSAILVTLRRSLLLQSSKQRSLLSVMQPASSWCLHPPNTPTLPLNRCASLISSMFKLNAHHHNPRKTCVNPTRLRVITYTSFSLYFCEWPQDTVYILKNQENSASQEVSLSCSQKPGLQYYFMPVQLFPSFTYYFPNIHFEFCIYKNFPYPSLHIYLNGPFAKIMCRCILA